MNQKELSAQVFKEIFLWSKVEESSNGDFFGTPPNWAGSIKVPNLFEPNSTWYNMLEGWVLQNCSGYVMNAIEGLYVIETADGYKGGADNPTEAMCIAALSRVRKDKDLKLSVEKACCGG